MMKLGVLFVSLTCFGEVFRGEPPSFQRQKKKRRTSFIPVTEEAFRVFTSKKPEEGTRLPGTGITVSCEPLDARIRTLGHLEEQLHYATFAKVACFDLLNPSCCENREESGLLGKGDTDTGKYSVIVLNLLSPWITEIANLTETDVKITS
ncbi:hypothetical protein STEG23_024669, partial [Scotinomys teguina]